MYSMRCTSSVSSYHLNAKNDIRSAHVRRKSSNELRLNSFTYADLGMRPWPGRIFLPNDPAKTVAQQQRLTRSIRFNSLL
jgi:hypothetical protein